jgi:hypothetical protein
MRIFDKTFDGWVENNIRFASAWKEGTPWDIERACLSVFGASVWMKGGYSLEEYTTEKKEPDRKKKSRKSGRQDIFIKIGNHEFIGEAKMTFSSLNSPNPLNRIEGKFDDACGDIRKCLKQRKTRLALLFVQPYWKLKSRKSRRPEAQIISSQIKKWIKEVKEIKHSCSAWVFPSVTRQAKFGKYILPGVMVLIRKV